MPMAYQGIFMMAEGTDSGICYMDSAEGMMDYCFQYVCQNTLIQEFGDEMYIKLCQGLEPNSFQEYINTIEAYCQSSENLRAAAEKLLIHKNTLTYRLNKIYDILDIAGLNSVRRMIMLRLLLKAVDRHRTENEQNEKA